MSDLPPALTNLLSRLAFYTSVRDNEKICFSGEFMVPASIGMGSIWRFYYGEKGIELITHTNQLIDDAYAGVRNKLFTIEHRAYIYRYIEDMKLAISRLCRSYNRDNKIKGDLEVCQTRIISMLRDVDAETQMKIMEIREQTSSSIHPSSSPTIPYTPMPTGSFVPKTPPTNQCMCDLSPQNSHQMSPQMQQQLHSEQLYQKQSEKMSPQMHQQLHSEQLYQKQSEQMSQQMQQLHSEQLYQKQSEQMYRYSDQPHQQSYRQIQEGTEQEKNKQIGMEETYLPHNMPKSTPIDIPHKLNLRSEGLN